MRRPRPSARLRLTLAYGGLFLVSGLVLLTITYLLVKHNTEGSVSFSTSNGSVGTVTFGTDHQSVGGLVQSGGLDSSLPPDPAAEISTLQTFANKQRNNQLHQLLLDSGIALAGMSVVSVGLGWLVAGRVLTPVRTISTSARRISASNLHERLELGGPEDEFHELGATLNDLLARLEASFASQRHFVANASHELRTPLAVERALIEVALADPDTDEGRLREMAQQLLVASKHNERLIESLLLLATSERGIEQWQDVSLAEVARDVVDAHQGDAGEQGVRMTVTTGGSASVRGDRALIESLVSNLVENGLRYNKARGTLEVVVSDRRIRVVNSGPTVTADEVARLLEPFQRMAKARTQKSGHGLGLSIVRAVAEAHAASLDVQADPEGGLVIEVRFP